MGFVYSFISLERNETKGSAPSSRRRRRSSAPHLIFRTPLSIKKNPIRNGWGFFLWQSYDKLIQCRNTSCEAADVTKHLHYVYS